jgi:membrane protease YdiL (CAAX protease family)
MDSIQFKKVGAVIVALLVVTAWLSYKSNLAMPLAVMVVLAPLYEELIFRGWILKKWGLVISCILFGLWHLKNLFYFEVNDVPIRWPKGLIVGPEKDALR